MKRTILRVLMPLVLVFFMLAVPCWAQKEQFYKLFIKIEIKPQPKAKVVELWVPLPPDDPFQQVQALKIKAPGGYLITQGGEYKNRYLYLRWTGPLLHETSLNIEALVRRQEVVPHPWPYKPPLRYLLSDRLVPVKDFKDMANQIVGDQKDKLLELRLLYDYVVSTLQYRKTGTGWGRGDALWACSHRHGNCTDFHSFLMALARAEGIPVLFEIGLPVPDKGGPIKGYHCWLIAFPKGLIMGLDASEAAKHPEKKDYFFGHLCPKRILITRGRDLLLAPPQHGPRLNFLYKAYLEVDLQPAPGAVRTYYEVWPLSKKP